MIDMLTEKKLTN